MMIECPDCGGDGKETCNNPDHGFIAAAGRWISRIGCPICGHDPDHKVPGGGKCETCNGTGEIDDMAGTSDAGQVFTVKDSGQRETFGSGMVRDTSAGKIRPDLVRDGPMYMRWVMLLTRGAIKYAARNWMKATGQEEYDRFLESADRHYLIWFMWRRFGINIENPDKWTREPLSEDHAAATYFNINGVEYVAEQMATEPTIPTWRELAGAYTSCDVATGQAHDVLLTVAGVVNLSEVEPSDRAKVIDALNTHREMLTGTKAAA